MIQNKYSKFHKTYHVLRVHFKSTIELRRTLLRLEPEQQKYFLRATHLIYLARKNKYLDLGLAGFLISNAAEVMGKLIYNGTPTKNHFKFLWNFGNHNSLKSLSRNTKYQQKTYCRGKQPKSLVIRDIDEKEIINIYYAVIRCLFTHEGESHLQTMKPNIRNCGTTCVIHPYKRRKYKAGINWVNNSTAKYTIINFDYEKYEDLTIGSLVKFLKSHFSKIEKTT